MKILQISDIHWSKTSRMLDEYKELRDGMMNYLELYRQQKKEQFDWIFICGDIAFSGDKEQYKKAQAFIQDLCEIIGCRESEVLMVPGNHDKNRKAGPELLRNELDRLMGDEKFKADALLGDALQNNIPSCKFLFEPFYEYDKFSSNFNLRETLMAKLLDDKKMQPYDEAVDKMYWDRTLKENLNGFNIYAYGVNTAFTCDANDFDFSKKGKNGHKMFLSKIAYNDSRCRPNSINILLAHHPVDFLVNGENIGKELDKLYQIQFFGHVHRTDSNVENGAIHIFSGALQPPAGEANDEDYKPVFNIVDINVINSGKKKELQVKLDVIAWNGEDFYKDFKKSNTLLLKNKTRTLNEEPMNESVNTSVDIDKSNLRWRFFKMHSVEKIVEEIKPGLYSQDSVDYVNRLNFWKYISQNGLWQNLSDKMKCYE